MKEYFTFFGFKINTRNFILTMVIGFAALLFLIGVDILWLDISWYGLLIGLGFILAIVVASELAKERGVYKDFSYDVIWYVFPLAIIGARAFYVLNSLHEFSSFQEMIGLGENGLAGLSIFGGIMGGTLGVMLFAWRKKINTVKLFDIAAPVLILGQTIGRWGNFFNQEVYGLEITNASFQWFPFAVHINNGLHSGYFLPLFFYESMLNLIGFFVLVTILRKNKQTGIVVFSYLAYYGTVRFALEFLRLKEYILYIPGTSIMASSLVSVMFIVIGIAGLLFLHIKNKKQNS